MKKAFDWICSFALKGIRAEIDFGNRSLKSQMKLANRLGASYVMIVGDDEIENSSIILRNMSIGSQVAIPIEGIVEKIESVLNLG